MARVKAMLAQDPLRRWNRLEAMETYGIARWGCGYFDISDTGNLIVTPRGPGNGTMDMRELIDELTGRGIQLPILLRFSDILRARIELICGAFNGAMKEYDYKGQYRGVYPIKVNQNRTVVEEIIEYGRPFHYGLEAGSKPELLTVMAIHQDDEALIICNGYKDEEYIETALLASKLGRTVVLVVEKPSELDQIHRVAERVGIRPTLGMRARLSSRGAGRWEQSGGDFSKFGLSAAEMVEAVGKLKSWGQVETLKLLHFHLGSQISAIKSIKNALREAGRLFVELYKLGASGLSYCDVGGGLGVDYDGSQTNFASSMNYSVQEYANDIVYTLKEICDADNVPHPHIVSESGRAVTAHHSVLVVNVLGVTEFDTDVPKEIKQPTAPLVKNLWETYQSVSPKTLLESYHDALEYKDQVLQLFNLGHLSLEHRVLCENLFWAVCDKVLHLVRSQPHMPEELEGLEKALSDTYFCNFSMFQSLPDAWAVDQLFPICPIHRLNEEPTRRATLADITCDSDGKIDSFIDLRDVKHVLELHPKEDGQDYYLGMFLVGAYQEILGDLHNLFGDTNTVHVQLGPDGDYDVKDVVAGDTVSEVLGFVDYSPSDLLGRLRANVEVALRKKLLTIEESRNLINRFRQGMIGYTYLDKE
ncbi:MAG: biosynthetic arginine decarboxylase [Kofleriaceae bacterium]|jgi:arginine decarboxylase|nr:biosynthetic arginine decarboxylase [Kofleriaceae bacterium]MBP9170812.1 biosynthetic arginine decarboxylase [Kofleriaceae bacterium]MBP9857673.1 biosynthetic arginine decarboxylase [Kofleriaceae bacterium]